MRKIETKSEKEKKDTQKKLIIGIVLIGLMILSTAGYAFSPKEKNNENHIVYNGYEFNLASNGLWYTNIGDTELITTYNPKDVEDIYVPALSINQYYNAIVYFDSTNREIEGEIARNLNAYVSRVQYACLDENDCKSDVPIKNCTENIIIIRESENDAIYQNDNCVKIRYTTNSSLKLADAFLFQVFGIRPS